MKKAFILLISLLFLVSSCSYNADNTKNAYSLYYIDAENESLFAPTPGKLNALTSEEAVAEAFLQLKNPESKKLSSAIPSDIKLIAVSVSDSVCKIELSSRYAKLPHTTKAAVDACLVKTICSIENIDNVIISCNDVVIGDFYESDFLISSPRTYYDIYTVNLYFANATFDSLQADRKTISISPDTTLEHTVISRLLAHSPSEKLKSAIPEGTKLNDIYVNEGVCVVDLSREFVDNVIHDKLHEGIAIYSIVNTMTELPMIDSVKILVEGKDVTGYIYYKLSLPLTNNSKISPTLHSDN